ncbi:hypothetical protein HPB47_016437 [Ixodes persulcatus]|uniref:Uncharacterized protein n=1 Tax=Ixodes persulcatus TaxID=34615 RepID=A0AC60QQX4_IXOPE|nr:hypothetical protein HPB47_016437 [Ixodes persulcatus]
MKVMDLKRELKARGLSTVGSKSELLDQLQAAAEVPGDLLRTVQCEEPSLDSDGELSADVLLPEGHLRALTEDKEGAATVSDFEGSFLTPPESMPTPGEIQDGSLLSSEWRMAARTQCRPDKGTTVQASQHDIKLINSPSTKPQEPLTSISCKGCAMLEQLCQTQQKTLEELGVRLNGFAERLQKTETNGSALKQLHRRITTIEAQLREVTNRNGTFRGMEAESQEAIPSTSNETLPSMSKEQSFESRVRVNEPQALDTSLKPVAERLDGSSDIGTDNGADEPHDAKDPDAFRNRDASGGVSKRFRPAGCYETTKGTPRPKSPPQRPPQGVTREVLVAGDSNVARIADLFQSEVNNRSCVEILLHRKATVERVHAMIDEYEEQARMIPRMYILHVGINNLLRGDKPEHVVECLQKRWSSRKSALTICSVPEVVTKGKEVHAVTMLLNAKLKSLCKKIRARYVDLGRNIDDQNTMDTDGVHYGRTGAQLVAQQLASVASRFLERGDVKSAGGKGRQKRKLSDMRDYHWRTGQKWKKPPPGFSDHLPEGHRSTASRLIKPSRHLYHRGSDEQPPTKNNPAFFPVMLPSRTKETNASVSYLEPPQLGQPLRYSVPVNRPPVCGLPQKSHTVDPEMQLLSATEAPGLQQWITTRAPPYDHVSPEWPPEMKSPHQHKMLPNGGPPTHCLQSPSFPTPASVAQLCQPLLPHPQDLRSMVADIVRQQLSYLDQWHRQ